MRGFWKQICCCVLTGGAAGWLAADASYRLTDPVASAVLLTAGMLTGAWCGPLIRRFPRSSGVTGAAVLAAVAALPPEPLLLLPVAAFAVGAFLTALPGEWRFFMPSLAAGVLLFAGGISFARRSGTDWLLLWLAVPGVWWWLGAVFRSRRWAALLLAGLLLAVMTAGSYRRLSGHTGMDWHGRDRQGEWHCRIVRGEADALQMIFSSGGRHFVLPRHLVRGSSAMLPAILQSPVAKPSLLVVTDAPSSALTVVEDLVGEIGLLSAGRRAVAAFYPQKNATCYWSVEDFFGRFDPASPYDVIVVLDLPPSPPAAKARLLARLRGCLAADGALVTPRAMQPDEPALPGCPEMTVSGRAAATDWASASARLAEHVPGSPAALLEMLYTYRVPEPVPDAPAQKAGMKIFAAVCNWLPVWKFWLPLPVLLAVFWGIRMWVARGVSGGAGWCVFADGVAVMTLVLTATMLVWQDVLLPGRLIPAALPAAVLIFPPGQTLCGGRCSRGLLVLGAAVAAWLFIRGGGELQRAGLILVYLVLLERNPFPKLPCTERIIFYGWGLLAGVVIFMLLPPGNGLVFAAGLLLPDLLFRRGCRKTA